MGENFSVTSTGDTLHLSLGVDQPHNNQYLFSDDYLENLLPRDSRWEAALHEADTFLAWLLELYASEKNQLAGYNESQLEDHWIRPILEKLGHTYEGQAAVPGLEKEIKRPDYVFFTDEAARQAAVGVQKPKITSTMPWSWVKSRPERFRWSKKLVTRDSDSGANKYQPQHPRKYPQAHSHHRLHLSKTVILPIQMYVFLRHHQTWTARKLLIASSAGYLRNHTDLMVIMME